MNLRSSLAVGVIALIAYLLLAPSVSGMGDSSEWTLVLATNGVAHPTGYPLYTLLGHLFCRMVHVFGVSWPSAANAWSALGGAIAVALLHAVALELTEARLGIGVRARQFAALLPTALFAVQPITLREATAAEVNIWSAAWTCGAGYAFVRLLRGIEPSPTGNAPRADRGAVLWGLLCGIGVAHHLTSILVSVPLSAALVAALAVRGALRPMLLVAAAASALLPIASYGIIAWRAWHPTMIQWGSLAPAWDSVVKHITGDQYRHFFGYFAPAVDEQALLTRAGYPFLIPGLLLLMLGALRAHGIERRLTWWGLTAAAGLAASFTLRYGVPDPTAYLLPAIALGAAAAAPPLASLVGVRGLAAWMRAGTSILVGLAVFGLSAAWIKEGLLRRREILGYDSMIRSMWSAIPSDTAIVLWPDDRFHRLREYQVLRGEKPALYVSTPDWLLESRTRETFRARFGIDPLQGLTIPFLRPGSPEEGGLRDRFLRDVMRNVNERARVPVILFDPSVPVVRKLRKPWEPNGP